MSKYRSSLPQLGDRLFLTDSGLETTLIFHDGIALPCFAAFLLLDEPAGHERLRAYYARHALMARVHRAGLVLEAPTWRANPDWGERLGYDATRLRETSLAAIRMLVEIRDLYESTATPVVISGNIGPRGDGYAPSTRMSPSQARDYHLPQVRAFAGSAADMVSAFTINYIDEAIGIVMAARECGLPVVISFTVETDGTLPSGESLQEAIEATDTATAGYPAYYMINCAHPDHFMGALSGEVWCRRIRGLRANASRRSHAELDDSQDLDIGDPRELAQLHGRLKGMMPWLTVVGGCCGTDHRHVESIYRAMAAGTDERGPHEGRHHRFHQGDRRPAG